jgi:hypothetical protein
MIQNHVGKTYDLLHVKAGLYIYIYNYYCTLKGLTRRTVEIKGRETTLFLYTYTER